jgi:hydroxymethylpyrimidine kinase/phosphomethylpyrimidine kinase
MSVITAVTAQNTTGVKEIAEISASVVSAQLTAVLDDIPPNATKVGMMSGASAVQSIADHARRYRLSLLVLDPAMRSSSDGRRLLSEAGVRAMRASLLPRTFLLTPNLDEAEELAGFPVRTPAQMEEAARAIHDQGPRQVLVKGGHLQEGPLIDVFFDGSAIFRLAGKREDGPGCHGTGCVLSSAITAYLARGDDVESAVSRGQAFVRRAIRNRLSLGRGIGPCDPNGLG